MTLASKFTDTDKGYQRLLDNLLGDLDEPGVLVGVRSETAGSEVVTYAAANEFGTSTVPERSFLRSTVDENEESYLDGLEGVAGVIADSGAAAGRNALEKLGLRAVRDVQRKIVDLKEPPNAASTIERKGSSNPLIDTGRLRQSIDYVVVEGEGS